MKPIINLFVAIFCFSCVPRTQAQISDKAEDISPLLIGEVLPSASLQDADGNRIELRSILKSKPTILVFYRGGWCPYCNSQLSGLAKIEKEILALGYQIVAISPDDYQNLKTTEERDSVRYALYADNEGKFIQDVGIAFQTPAMMKTYIASKGQKGKTSESIPVPTVMVVDKEGKILFEYISPNYKERLSGEMLLAVAKILAK